MKDENIKNASGGEISNGSYTEYDKDERILRLELAISGKCEIVARLAKIEVIDEVCRVIDSLELPMRAINAVNRMREDIKKGK